MPVEIDVEITDKEISFSASEGLAATSSGALVSFLGIVRDKTDGRKVTALEYEAYASMAESSMRQIAEEANDNWDVQAIRLVHRVGRLTAGEVSVLVSVASAHRGPAFDACEYCIDRIKETVPIWKKEVFEDGEETWVNHP